MSTDLISNILRDIYDIIKSSEKAEVTKGTNWYIDDKPDDLEREY